MGDVTRHENESGSGPRLRGWLSGVACALRSHVVIFIIILVVLVALYGLYRMSVREHASLLEQTQHGRLSGVHVSAALSGFDPDKCTTRCTFSATAQRPEILRHQFERVEQQATSRIHINVGRMVIRPNVTEPVCDVVLDEVGNGIYSGQEVVDIFLGEKDPEHAPFFYPFDVYALELRTTAIQVEEFEYRVLSTPIDSLTVKALLPGFVVKDFKWVDPFFEPKSGKWIAGFRLTFQRPFLNRAISISVLVVLGIVIWVVLARTSREDFLRVSAPLAISIWGLREVIMPDTIHWPTFLDVVFMVLYLVLGVGLVWRLRTASPAQGTKS